MVIIMRVIVHSVRLRCWRCGHIKNRSPVCYRRWLRTDSIFYIFAFARYKFFASKHLAMKKISCQSVMVYRMLTGKTHTNAGVNSLLPLCALLFFLFSFTTPDNKDETEWKLDKTVHNVRFYHSVVSCNGKNVVLLKLLNMNSYKVSVSWKELFVTKQIREKSAGASGKKELILAPGEISASGCQETKNRSLVILPSDISPAYEADVEKFEFSEIAVSPAN